MNEPVVIDLTVAEVADALGVSTYAVRKAIARGVLPARRGPRKVSQHNEWLMRSDDVETYRAAHSRPRR